MGRSVSTPSNAVEVFYLDYLLDEDDLAEALAESLEINEATDLCEHDKQAWANDIQSDQFDWILEDLRLNVLPEVAPSMDDADRWLDNEDHVIAENRLAAIGVSEYCGLAAVWIVVNEPRDYYLGDKDTTGLALHWIGQVWPKVEAMFPHRLGLMGRFSNGEAVYQRTERTET